jgi:hypothetical protein
VSEIRDLLCARDSGVAIFAGAVAFLYLLGCFVAGRAFRQGGKAGCWHLAGVAGLMAFIGAAGGYVWWVLVRLATDNWPGCGL